MIKRSLQMAGVVAMLMLGTSCSSAQTGVGTSLKSGQSTLGNLIEGVFSTSKLDIDDLAGEWTASGSAVKFKSENMLKKAGGIAAAAAIESKLDPYYKTLGLNGAVLTVQTDGTFKMTVKRINLTGRITKLDNGNFNFNFQILGGMSIGNIETYISKSSGQMDVMFDADKLISIIELVGKFSGMKTIKAVTDILKGYDGICVGFKMEKTGKVEGEKTSLGGVLNGIFNGNSGSNSNGGNTKIDTKTDKKTNDAGGSSQNSGTLLDLLKKKR